MLSEVRFGSFLVYAPRGTNEISRRAQQFVRALKEERPIGAPPQSPSDYAARRLADEHPASLFDALFADSPLLVPVPRSSLPVQGGIWPAYNIASALVQHGIGAAILPCLKRVKAVPKSAFAASGTRPKPIDHYESIHATKMVTDRLSLCLIDDVITKGATLLAAASRLQEAYPQAKVTGFALVRTLGFVDDIERIVEPVIGMITLRGDEAFREL
ncbi:MAG TPA: phosphoribosyltransferase [Thermoanaerobaculia bacterium]|nr:phosphoribosyltransferase [Thermoanaerobaculia bacterium]